MKPPKKIDHAIVLEYAWSDIPFGAIKYSDSDKIAAEIHGFLICKYDNSDRYYRFSCNKNWEVENDAAYDSIEQAKNSINENQYNLENLHWRKIT